MSSLVDVVDVSFIFNLWRNKMKTVATAVEVNVANELTKKQQIIDLLKLKPHLTANQVAREVGCHVTSVYEHKKGGFMKAKITRAEVTKTQRVRDILKDKPTLTPKEIANIVGCDLSIVYEERTKMGGGVKVKVQKAKKEKAVKMGRPNLLQNIEKACETLLQFVGARKDMCIAFDHSKKKVEIVWGEEIYNAGTEEVIDVLMAIKKLDTHRQSFN
jgi:hypothetical protein